jgi:hypothetical protein
MNEIPRSRYEFVLRLYDEFLRIKDRDPERASGTNVRWIHKPTRNIWLRTSRSTWDGWGTTPPTERSLCTIRFITTAGRERIRRAIPPMAAFILVSRLFVDLIQLTNSDLAPLMDKPRLLEDPFAAFLAHLDDASTHVEEIYIMDKTGAFADKSNTDAARLVKSQLAKAAALLRDLVYTAWVESVSVPGRGGGRESDRLFESPIQSREGDGALGSTSEAKVIRVVAHA